MKDFDYYLNESGEYGLVEKVATPLVWLTGLPSAKPDQLVMFENGSIGEVFTLEENLVQVALISDKAVDSGTRATLMNDRLKVAVGQELLGQMVDSIGNVISPIEKPFDFKEFRYTDTIPKSIIERKRIKDRLVTGVSVIDLIHPLGKGQRELVVGDRKTGKTSFLFPMMTKQARDNSVVVFASIGKKSNETKRIYNMLKSAGVLKNTVIVASMANQSPSLIYHTPFTAMTIAEYFRDQGRDVVIVLDDLSTHAKFYREMALIGKRFPGRDSYPGDTFHVHARILERAGNFINKDGSENSITCFPIAETMYNDLTNYIVSNLIGITDGHILFDNIEFSKGRRPAVNIFLTVTRVGRQTQSHLQRQVSERLVAFLNEYSKLQRFLQFSAELSDEIRKSLRIGKVLYEFFNQKTKETVDERVQLVVAVMIWNGLFLDEMDERINQYRDILSDLALENKKFSEMLDEIVSLGDIDKLIKELTNRKVEIIEACKTRKY